MSQDLKIPVVASVNDNPIPPNFNNNRRGCNGSYVVDKHNKLVDVINATSQLSSPDINFSIANLPTYLELGEPLTTLSNPLVFNYSYGAPDVSLYANYTHGDSIQTLVPLTGAGIKIPQNNLYEYVYTDTLNQPNTYVVPHTRVFGINLYELSTEYPLPHLTKYLEVRWLPKVVIGQSSADDLTDFANLTSILYEDFNLPVAPLDILNTAEYTYVFLPRNTSGQSCYDGLQSIIADKLGFIDVTPYSSILTLTSSLGLGVEITYDVYKLPANSEAYRLVLSFSADSTLVITSTTNIITQLPAWSTIDW